MEELSEDSVDQKREWVRFDEDQERAARAEGHGEPAVIAVDNGPKATNRTASPANTSAVIEASQVHVSVDRHSNPPPNNGITATTLTIPNSVAAPSPAPRLPRESKAPARPSRSAAAASANRSQVGSPDAVVVSVPLNVLAAAAASTHHDQMHTVSLTDASNGANPISDSNSIMNNMRSNQAITQPFANGDILVTILPQNEKCPWLTRAEFRPELVPEELMSQHLTLTVEEYLSAMEILVNDFRFNCYNICYKRILMSWIMFSFLALLVILFSGIRGVTLFGLGVLWLLINASGIFVCMWIKIRLRYHLEGCVAQVNKYFVKHKILLGVDDRGKLSCHKVNLIFIYFDCGDCVKKLHDVLENEDKLRNGQRSQENNKQLNNAANNTRLGFDDSDVIITGSTNTRVSRQQERGERLLLRYSQRWVKEYVCKRLDLNVDTYDRQDGEPAVHPRHCVTSRCPCQFIEEHLRFKPMGLVDCYAMASAPIYF